MEIDRRYGDLGPGLVDASLVVLAEIPASAVWRRGMSGTLRRYDFVTVARFELVVRPTDPEK
jgi:hypothetical protein